MEGNSTWKPNEQGEDSFANNNANDWRSQIDIRRKVFSSIVEKLKKWFPTNSLTDINKVAITFECMIHDMATNKDDYLRKIIAKIRTFDRKFRIWQSNNVQSGSLANGTNNTPDSVAQALNQGQSLPTSMPYTQTLTSQQWLPQNNIQNNLNIPESSGLQTQVSVTVSAAQNLNNQMGEGGHLNLREQPLAQQQQPQQQLQSSKYFQNQMDQQLLNGNLRPLYMQQQAQQQQHQPSLLKQPIQEQFSHQASLSNIQQSFPQSFALSSLPSSSQQKSQFLPRYQQPMAVPSQEQNRQEREQIINQLINGQDTLQNHLTSRQSNGEQQGTFMVSSSQQNNMASFQERPEQSNNIQNMHQQQGLSSHSNNASALPSQQRQHMHGGQFGNYNVHGSILLGTQGQEVGQSQPIMQQQHQPQHPVEQQQQQPQNRILQQPLDNTQKFQAEGSLSQNRNLADQQNQPYQLQRTHPANPSTPQDSTGKTVNASGDDWQEETYQKIKALKQKYLRVLITMFQKILNKLREIDSVPQQNMQHELIEKLRTGKSTLGRVLMFLNVSRSRISEIHRDKFSLYEEQVLRITKPHPTVTWKPIQQQKQLHLPPSQIHQTALHSQSGHQAHVSQSLNSDQMNSRLMPSHQNKASSSVSGLLTSNTEMPHSLQTWTKMDSKDENNVMFSSGNVVLPSLKQSPATDPQVLHSNISPAQFSMSHHLPMQQEVLQRQQQQPQTNQQPCQILKSDMRIRQGVNIKDDLLQQHLSSSQRQLEMPLASRALMSNVSPSTSSPQLQNDSSPLLVEQQILPTTFYKTGTSSQSGGLPFVAPSPNPGDPEMPISVDSPVCPAQEHPPSTLSPEQNAERPIDRLIKAFQSSSPESLAQSVSEMGSVISLADRFAGSVHSIGGSRAALAEDLSARTRFRLQQGETNPTKRFKRSISTMPIDIASETDSFKQFSSLESVADYTASSGSKVNKIEPDCALLQEIREINGRLVETVVSICNEDVCPSEVTSGTIVTCSYVPVALSATFKALYKSGHISQIQPLRLVVPTNYPHSPILIEKFLFEASVHNYEDLSARTRSRFSLSMKEFSERMSLTEIAQAWDDCARATMAEYAERHGGGTFSSKYGHWVSV